MLGIKDAVLLYIPVHASRFSSMFLSLGKLKKPKEMTVITFHIILSNSREG